jgi:hypothetical protein
MYAAGVGRRALAALSESLVAGARGLAGKARGARNAKAVVAEEARRCALALCRVRWRMR